MKNLLILFNPYVMATSDFEIIPIVKSWILFIKVISPQRIQDKVKEEATKFLSL